MAEPNTDSAAKPVKLAPFSSWQFLYGPEGAPANVAVTLVVFLVTIVVAQALDAAGFSDATPVMVYVLGVIVTAMLTSGRMYCFVATVLAVLGCNYFMVTPRLSFAVSSLDYLGTLVAMFVVALLASQLVTLMRQNARASMEASLVAQDAQLRSDLLRSVSHDLRTPLTSISGNADMLLDDQADLTDEERERLIENIYHDSVWLNDVVENLLAATRIEQGTVKLKLRCELVSEIIEEALDHVSRDVSRHNLVVEQPDDLLLARMDGRVIVHVIVNLVNNAIYHTQEGSTITISSWRENGMCAIRVADDGPGVPDDDKEHIFEAFFTSPASSPDSTRSLGLGLSLCRSIVEAHGGTIHVEDVEPHGAAFVFTLPEEEEGQHD